MLQGKYIKTIDTNRVLKNFQKEGQLRGELLKY